MTTPMLGKITVNDLSCQTPSQGRYTPRWVVLASILGVMLLVPVSLSAGELFDRGADAFLYNRPREAATLLERAIEEEPANSRAYLYLALSYEQLQMHDRAITTLRRAESIPGIDRSQVFFNLGNNFVHLGEMQQAERAYSDSIDISPLASDPYLNRANVRVALETFDKAVEDYSTVLGLEPEHQQRQQIEQMIALLTDHMEQERIKAEEEQRRLEEEARQRAIEEAARIAEEERRRAEAEERRRALLTGVLDSLKTATDDTTNLSAGSEELDDYNEEEFDIAD